jgi:hypothetical protein
MGETVKASSKALSNMASRSANPKMNRNSKAKAKERAKAVASAHQAGRKVASPESKRRCAWGFGKYK